MNPNDGLNEVNGNILTLLISSQTLLFFCLIKLIVSPDVIKVNDLSENFLQ